jgi:hypothetical protein
MKAAPTGVHQRDPTGRCIGEGQWHAVGDEYGEREMVGVGEEGVRLARVSDERTVEHIRSVNLANRDEAIGINSGRASDEGSVLAYVILIVTHVVAEVQ